MTTKFSKTEIADAKEMLLHWLKPGDTVYTKLLHVSRSGMYRVIDLMIIRDNQPIYISYNAAKLLEGWDERHNGCKAGGCGMDMGFHLVYNLSYALFHDYDCLNDIGNDRLCPSPDHVNHYPEGCRDNKHHSDGYALKQRWL